MVVKVHVIPLKSCLRQRPFPQYVRDAEDGDTGLTVALLLCAAKGYVPAKDQQDGYSFIYPFGWQEVSVTGQDVVYKDIIEPLESASVAVTPTDKQSVEQYGGLGEVQYSSTALNMYQP